MKTPTGLKNTPDGEISRQKREPEDWLIAVITAKETRSAAAELSQSHRTCGELQFSCRLSLQATSTDHVIGFRAVGHVENRATFPVHFSLGMNEYCTHHYKETFLTRCQVPSALGEITLLLSKNADGSNR